MRESVVKIRLQRLVSSEIRWSAQSLGFYDASRLLAGQQLNAGTLKGSSLLPALQILSVALAFVAEDAKGLKAS